MMPSAIPHRIERTRNRHSRAVYRGNTIVIRLARGLSRTEEQEHIENLLKRMTKQVLREHIKTVIDPFRPLLQGEAEHTVTLADGTAHLFRLRPGLRTKAKRITGGWEVSVAPGMRRQSLHRFLWSLLADVEQQKMRTIVENINARTFQFEVRDVRVGYAATQWGSCSSRGDIMLNAVLLFVPRQFLEYVIVHELAHRRIKSHSDAFWNLVSGPLPAWKTLRKELQNFRICSL